MQAEALYALMRKRRSIRKYKPDPVPREVLERILEAATWAPSGKNLQNWRFFVLQGKKRDEYLQYSQKSWDSIRPILEKRLKPSLYAFTERFFYTLGDAPVLIFAYNKPDPEENNQTSLGSVYMAVQNLLLAAEAEGLGTCALGSPLEVREEVDRFLGVDDTDLQLVCGVTVGYPDHEPPAAPRQPDRITWIGFD
ncbi:MAG TPA: nitroreductase family protein [Oculatellaceae cyanobacterium]|jgi:nitroreductase